ncbi:MAG TPA: hypothetical protein VGT79_05730, partial [Xanthomonadaceae bacterium]|nr:hypothetical protein [Xanthomonadaceae bacterium]
MSIGSRWYGAFATRYGPGIALPVGMRTFDSAHADGAKSGGGRSIASALRTARLTPGAFANIDVSSIVVGFFVVDGAGLFVGNV